MLSEEGECAVTVGVLSGQRPWSVMVRLCATDVLCCAVPQTLLKRQCSSAEIGITRTKCPGEASHLKQSLLLLTALEWVSSALLVYVRTYHYTMPFLHTCTYLTVSV